MRRELITALRTIHDSHDAGWRHYLGGKPAPIQKHPDSILYNFLTSPRNLTPRWYMEGSAVFMETWMAGGLGRAGGNGAGRTGTGHQRLTGSTHV